MTEEQVFLAALELTGPADRTAYLDKACGGDVAFRRQVEELLTAHFKTGEFLDQPLGNQIGAGWSMPISDNTVSVHTNQGSDAVADETKPDEEPNDLYFLQPSTFPDSLGRIGHYEVLQILGKGGFGIVFRAFDEALQRAVALKVLAPTIAAASPARKRFLREARSSAQIRHENVVQVYVVEEQPLPYLVMEFIPGETLQQRLNRTGPLEASEIVRLARQIAEGLAAAHATGLIHRDIKPGNILLEGGPQGLVKITDFGLARAADDASLSQSGALAGTPMYMSPEQAKGEKLDHRADLFSLGSVMYVMATGRPPFRASTTFAVLKRVVEDAPRSIQEVIPEVPHWLCAIIARLQAKKPEDRFATAREVADLLGRCLAEIQRPGIVPNLPDLPPTTVKQAPASQKIPEAAPAIRRPRFRTRRWAAAAAVILMLLGGLGVTEATGVTDFHGTVIRLFSPEGTLVVEVDDPGVSVKIDGPDIVITGAGAQEIRLKPGNYTVETRKDGKIVSKELVTVTKNGKQVVRVSQEAPPDAKAAKTSADVTAWERAVAGLSAAQQVKFVAARMQDLNPDFDGNINPTIENGIVTGLVFSTDQVSDISPVRALTKLRSLDCCGSEVGRGRLSDRSLLPLRGLPLTNLRCIYSPVSDLSSLKGMKLTGLDLRHTNVSDADVKNLAGQKNLQTLSLWGTKVTDAGLKELAGLKSLQWLSLENTGVTDVGLKKLAGLQNLVHLSLYAVPQVTDGGLEELAGLKALNSLDLRGTNVRDAGTKKLASALPSLRIHWRDGVIEPSESPP
ncbi:MAG TPA: protein kinase [Gemmataceae bacterium]